MSGIIEWVTAKVSDGTSMRLCVARPQTHGDAKIPAVIVLQEAFGLNAHMRDLTQRISGLGYLAVAPELFHRAAPGFECAYEDRDSAMSQIGAMTDEGLSADLKAVYEWLKGEAHVDINKVAAAGYCMGGRAAWMANALLPLKAAVSYYGGRIAPGLLPLAAAQHGPVLLFWGGKDVHIGTQAQVDIGNALRTAGKSFVNVEFSDADHGFFCDDRKAYHPKAARESWSLFTRFLRESMDQ